MPASRLSPVSSPRKLKWLAAGSLAGLLAACAPVKQAGQEAAPGGDAGQPSATTAESAEARPFPIETFYTILVAEVAGNREHYDVALANYYHQAASTRDAGIAARATRIARFLNARRAALDSALLWVELEPSNPEAQLAVTAELTLAGELEKALEHAGIAMALGGDAPLQSLAATAVSNRELTERVMPTFCALADKYPENPEAALALAMTLRATEQYDAALTIVRRVQERQPDLLDAPLLESHLLVDQGKKAEALAMLEKLVSIYPQESRLRLQYARLLVSEDLQKAQTQFTELVRQRPRDGNLILSLALIRFETDNLDEARPLFERLLELEQHESAAHFYLGGIAEEEQRLEQAVAHYRQVGPGNDYLSAIKRGTELLASSGLSADNRDWFSELRQRHPDQAEHFYLVEVDLLRRHQREEEALQLLNQALREKADSGRLLYAQALVNEALGNAEAFEQGMRKLIARDPDNATLLNALGYKLTDFDDRLDEARALIVRALELRPDDPAIIDSMGWVEYRQGNHAEAVKHLENALEKLPDHEIAAHLGEVLWMQGNREQAVKVWERGLEINPESKIIPAAMERLRIREAMEQHVSDS
ncbi:tetratricopeptide repeat protein [Microbulbifer yueqingensis]|uniref:Tetratricopeptide repeat-containing protein n=1 Tax=Microbulbifer yueqingensis TaxID=658219 RepID=A0A1G8X419_9GAMM|nr:tetratricopeptide repeat protein [Microbulbifer yueqingensis]SDJ85204.1 Tetratricopeptide repeat-containing protein [Microbulbifer yueqingensis]